MKGDLSRQGHKLLQEHQPLFPLYMAPKPSPIGVLFEKQALPYFLIKYIASNWIYYYFRGHPASSNLASRPQLIPTSCDWQLLLSNQLYNSYHRLSEVAHGYGIRTIKSSCLKEKVLTNWELNLSWLSSSAWLRDEPRIRTFRYYAYVATSPKVESLDQMVSA